MSVAKTMILLAVAMTAGAATAQIPAAPATRSLWTTGFNQGISEYQTGTFDQPTDGGVRLACLPNGNATVSVQIKGAAPAAGGHVRLITNSRSASQSFDYTAGPDGTVTYRANAPQFRRLWNALRGGSTVTIRYPDNSFSVQSLVGASRTLPVRACR